VYLKICLGAFGLEVILFLVEVFLRYRVDVPSKLVCLGRFSIVLL
jgi:hypothetical protein